VITPQSLSVHFSSAVTAQPSSAVDTGRGIALGEDRAGRYPCVCAGESGPRVKP
jgi:hypothetical protein